MASLRLPEPLPQQIPVLESPASRKVVRAGRRYGKSRLAMIAALDGHGPVIDGKKKFPGVLQGWDVVWVAQDYPQLSTVMWREEFIPRFKHLPFIDMNANDHFVSVKGLGTLYLRPDTAINGIRGIGKKLKGVILDEAAWYDIEASLRDVILPALLDNEGWILLMSTTNDGHDGNSQKRVPSYFNVICDQIQNGSRSAEWVEFYGTAFDNPRLSRTAIEGLIAEYDEGTAALEQEVYAKLRAGGGRFYPELGNWKESSLIVKPSELPKLEDWFEYWGGFDWGFSHPAVLGTYCRVGNTVYKLDTLYMHKYQDEEQAATIASSADKRCLKMVYAGSDAFAQRKAHVAGVETVAQVFERYSVHLEQANVDKLARAKVLRRLFSDPHGPLKPDQLRIRFVDTPGNRRCLEELASLIPDTLNLNVPAKRDANERGLNGDDGADETSFALATPSLEPVEPLPLYQYSNVTDGKAEPAPWEVLENKYRMPDEDGVIDRRVYENRRGRVDSSDAQFGSVDGW